jgi:hypothetical protein
MTEKRATLTDRDRYWLRQQESWEKSGLSVRDQASHPALGGEGSWRSRRRIGVRV